MSKAPNRQGPMGLGGQGGPQEWWSQWPLVLGDSAELGREGAGRRLGLRAPQGTEPLD